jgi:hypothetical protein
MSWMISNVASVAPKKNVSAFALVMAFPRGLCTYNTVGKPMSNPITMYAKGGIPTRIPKAIKATPSTAITATASRTCRSVANNFLTSIKMLATVQLLLT